jgi:hypothetical protein
MSNNDFKVMCLLGAGVSIPAGLPGITNLTEKFFKEFHNDLHRNKVLILRDIAKDYYNRDDLETFLSILHKLKNPRDLNMFLKTYEVTEIIDEKDLVEIIHSTQKFIRENLEDIKTIDYLSHFRYLKGCTDIFTLNYDSLFEIVWEKGNIPYTDGFSPFWNPELFESNDFRYKLYKLHGSLHWFETSSGKLIKIPIKGLDTSKLKYITDESLSEILIYPTIQKDKGSLIYDSLNHIFFEFLNRYDLCIIIGYSFRDEDISNKIVESIKKNDRLWIVLVSPNSEETIDIIKKQLNRDQQLRTSNRKSDIAAFLNESFMSVYIDELRQNITRERDLWSRVLPLSVSQLAPSGYFESEWNTTLMKYKQLGFLDRALDIVGKLRTENKMAPDRLSVIEGPLHVK